ncbi:MAG TPA: alpha/beta hydrolase [Anaerolineaceae bacterium]|nr:alpha/beta hydrolase [Anaerolineaceae bacterium]
MSETSKKVGKGLLWGFGSLIGATVATAAGWIVYSKRFINHNFKLAGALEGDRLDYISKRAGRLSYYVDNTRKGTPLVLLHSINAASSAFEMRPLFDHYRQTRPVYVLDLPGFGLSERSDRLYSPQLYQDAVSDFLQDVVGEPADVVALSLSSEFAALTAVHDPELIRSLALISPTGFNPLKTSRMVELARQRGTQSNLYAGLAVPLWNRPLFDLITSRPSIQIFLNKSFEGLVPTSFVDYAYHTAHQPGAQYAPTYFLSGKLFTAAVRETVYKVVGQPVLVLYDRDPYTNFEMLPGLLREKENWQGVRITPTKGLPHWEQPEKTIQALEAFWSAL